ncbi:MAG: TetR/AcrR family transcriptional regulator [Planctomycetes bacterium]|nr:TetR/AcrR family transcriptional regulator [Planctomycetota bacterium]
MPGSGSGKKPVKRSAPSQKKKQYLDCARRLFAEFSYPAVGFDQIAESAGVSRSVLAKSFKDKPAFLRAIGEVWLESLFATETLDPAASHIVNRLLSFTERFLDAMRSDQPTAQIILAGLAEPIQEEESIILQSIVRSAIDRLLPIILDGQNAGEIRRGIDPRETAADWMRFLLGSALLPRMVPHEGDPPTQIIETMLHGLLKTDV